jgi:NitT/TauT family transport system permease protein
MSRLRGTTDFIWVTLVLIGFWQALTLLVGDTALPSPLHTIHQLGVLMMTGKFWMHAAESGKSLLIAGLVTALGGVVLGLALGLHRFSGEVAKPILVAIYSLPKVAIYPLILLFFGLGLSAKVALGVLNGFPPVSLFTMSAVGNIRPSIIRTARVFRLSPWEAMRTVLIPAALPEILSGIRVGMALTMVGVLIGEIFASNRGLGFVLTQASQLDDNRTVMAVTLFIVIAALTLNWLLGLLTRR